MAEELPAAGRVLGWQKGGRLAGCPGGAELMDLLAEGIETEAEAFRDVLLATAIDEDGTEGFVEALGVVSGLEEEKAIRGVVHGFVPACEALLSRNSLERIAAQRREGHARSPGKPRQQEIGPDRGRRTGSTGAGAREQEARIPWGQQEKAHRKPRLKPGKSGLRGSLCEELGRRGNRR